MQDKRKNGHFKWYQDINGDISHGNIITMYGAVIGYLIVIAVVLYGLRHVISSPDVVSRLCEVILGAPFVGIIADAFKKVRGRNVNTME